MASHWEEQTEKARLALAELGVAVPASTARLVAEIRELGNGPQAEARAKLDLVVAKTFDDGVKGLVAATQALVRSSDGNTEVMSRLASRLNLLTGLLVVVAVAQLWLLLRHNPTPINVNVPAPVVQIVPAPTPAPSMSPPPRPAKTKR